MLPGYVADRFERKVVLIAGYVMLGMGVLTLTLSSTYIGHLASLILAGVGAGFIIPPYYSMVGTALKNLRGFVLGLAGGIYYLGGFLGSILVGLFVDLRHWRFAYAVIAMAIFFMTGVQQFVIKGSYTRLSSKFNFSFFT